MKETIGELEDKLMRELIDRARCSGNEESVVLLMSAYKDLCSVAMSRSTLEANIAAIRQMKGML
jgi:hypothetical protein